VKKGKGTLVAPEGGTGLELWKTTLRKERGKKKKRPPRANGEGNRGKSVSLSGIVLEEKKL